MRQAIITKKLNEDFEINRRYFQYLVCNTVNAVIGGKLEEYKATKSRTTCIFTAQTVLETPYEVRLSLTEKKLECEITGERPVPRGIVESYTRDIENCEIQ